ncbi:DedA family protein [Streptomyces sp. NPDC026672]|uniref:DedA family protein n=1 Tax=unclassified Streptomyces TaxID=2593676 RepID=UPI0033C47C61
MLETIPPAGVYASTAVLVGLQFLCLPVPGGIALLTAALLASRGHVDPVLVCASVVAGVCAGASAGHAMGRRGGRPVLGRLGERFPRALSPRNLARTEAAFDRRGLWVVTASCFSSGLRMVIAPLSGALAVRFGPFLVATATSAALWAGSTTAAVYAVGQAAESWINRLSAVSLAALVVLGAASALRRRTTRRARRTGP